VERPHSRLIPPAPLIPAQPAHASTAPCTHCGSPDTELLAMMQRYTCDADDWVQCNDCGYVFTTSRWRRITVAFSRAAVDAGGDRRQPSAMLVDVCACSSCPKNRGLAAKRSDGVCLQPSGSTARRGLTGTVNAQRPDVRPPAGHRPPFRKFLVRIVLHRPSRRRIPRRSRGATPLTAGINATGCWSRARTAVWCCHEPPFGVSCCGGVPLAWDAIGERRVFLRASSVGMRCDGPRGRGVRRSRDLCIFPRTVPHRAGSEGGDEGTVAVATISGHVRSRRRRQRYIVCVRDKSLERSRRTCARALGPGDPHAHADLLTSAAIGRPLPACHGCRDGHDDQPGRATVFEPGFGIRIRVDRQTAANRSSSAGRTGATRLRCRQAGHRSRSPRV
jgi:hypothetical protein